MKHIKEYNEFVSDELNEFFNLPGINLNIFSGFFNRGKKRKILKLIDQLTQINVDIAKLSLKLEIGDFTDYVTDLYNDSDDHNNKSINSDPVKIKIEALKDTIESIENQLSLIADDNEKLIKFLEIQKIKAKIKANDEIIKFADTYQVKMIKKFQREANTEIKKKIKEI